MEIVELSERSSDVITKLIALWKASERWKISCIYGHRKPTLGNAVCRSTNDR